MTEIKCMNRLHTEKGIKKEKCRNAKLQKEKMENGKLPNFQKYLGYFYAKTRDFLKPGFHAVCYIGTMPLLVQIETWFFGIIHCM